MTIVSRQVRKVEDPTINRDDTSLADLRTFRNLPAWVLLGEPGAGKSTAFEAEAEASGGVWLRIAEFIEADPDETWRGKPLFLDGLDEVRASSGADNTLLRIRSLLKSLGYPPFRIACRAADWYGSSDTDDLKSASIDGQVTILQLEPLSEDDILTILHENHGVATPHDFVEQARRFDVNGLLNNPQTLGLLAKAIRGNQWPETRDDTYRLACEQLAIEDNRRHRDQARIKPWSVDSILDAAGQLCAVLLLSDQTGIALDLDRADTRFIVINSCAPPDTEAAAQAVRRKLFRPDGEERVVPSHRSVAEYLAARWLAQRIETGLPIGRVLNLMQGLDGRTVSGLRGLYAWLALHSRKARSRLIDADPLTVVLYGDVKPMPAEDKRKMLEGLRRETGQHGFRWYDRNTHRLAALAAPELHDDFLTILQAPVHDEADQAFMACVLEVLADGRAEPDLGSALLSIVRHDHLWPLVRHSALDAWLVSTTTPQAVLSLLDDIRAGRVADHDDELTGILLRHLYPKHLGPETLLDYLHLPKNTNLSGSYSWFWTHELPEQALGVHVPILLDGLVVRPEIQRNATYDRTHNEMADKLLARGVTIIGDAIPDERLFTWLGIGADEYGEISREKSSQETIAAWLRTRPNRYKALLEHCFEQCKGVEHPIVCINDQINRLHHALPPDDLGLWHLVQVDKTADDGLARIHLMDAISALINERGAAGLSLERLEAWAAEHPERKEWLEAGLACQVTEQHLERITTKKNRLEASEEARRNRTIVLQPHLAQIQSGTARVNLMHELAGVWMGMYTDTPGKTPADRFDRYCGNGPEVFAMAEAGFRRCPERDDLPTVDEIIELNINEEYHYVRRPCLLGMELRWRDGVEMIDALPDDTLRRMLAFRLTYGAGSTPEWFQYLVQQRAELMSEVLINYAATTLKAGKDHIDSIYPLEHDQSYRVVATLAASHLLEAFPIRARSGQLHYLDNLLKATLRYAQDQLPALIELKLSMKGMDATQKVYWLATATLLDAKHYETKLWQYVGKSESRANDLSRFLSMRFGEVIQDYLLSAGTLGKLIEQLAPHAEIEWPRGGGDVTDGMQRGERIRALINRLGAFASLEAEQELNRLLEVATLSKWKSQLQVAQHELKQRRRENEFRFLGPREVAHVLGNQAPTGIADLVALALDVIDDIGQDIRHDDDDGFRAFWNVWKENNNQKKSQREENYCRDVLALRLRARLGPLDVDCQIEKNHANDKRADLSLSYHAKLELPIEIKRNSNEQLWSGLHDQLVDQYAIAPRAYGYGIYLVFWFGEGGMPRGTDGGEKPRSPVELRTQLEAQLDPLEQQRIFVRVLDVSWP